MGWQARQLQGQFRLCKPGHILIGAVALLILPQDHLGGGCQVAGEFEISNAYLDTSSAHPEDKPTHHYQIPYFCFNPHRASWTRPL